jgi:hypothetical protein
LEKVREIECKLAPAWQPGEYSAWQPGEYSA